MQINSGVEELTRKLFGYAIRAELDDLQTQLRALDQATMTEALRLAVMVAGAVVLDVTEGKRPSDADLRKMASTAASVEKRYALDEDKVYTYLARSVFGDVPLEEALGATDVASVPFLVTGNLLGSYTHEGQKWWEFLDQIEAAIEAAPDPAQP